MKDLTTLGLLPRSTSGHSIEHVALQGIVL